MSVAKAAIAGLICLAGCGGSVEAEPVLKDNYLNCYVEPAETRCDQTEPFYCYAPQTRPFAKYCESKALDTGTNVGEIWCCASFVINGTEP